MYWISLSGGLGSAITTLAAWERGLEFEMVFADTLIEDEDLYRFVIDVAMQVRGDRPSSGHTLLVAMARNIPHLKPDDSSVMRRRKKYLRMMAAMANAVIPGFRWLIDGRTPWDVYVDKKWVGNTRTAHCSNALKTDHVKVYIEEHGAEDDPLVLGMDWSEMDRIERARKRWEPRPVVSLLNELKVERPEYDLILNRYGIRKPRLYGEGFSHNNCFHGDTRFITADGIKTLRECVGREVVVLGRNHGWRRARVEYFGRQELLEIVLTRYGRKKTILATADHRWFVRQTRDRTREVLTKDLPTGKRLVGAHGRLQSNVRPSAFGVAHGIVFGDGTAVQNTWNNPAKTVLCGAKDEQLLRWFPNSPMKRIEGVGTEVRDLPRTWKKPPDLSESQSYLYGWLAGYFAADGSVTGGEVRIASSKETNLHTVLDVCAKLGISTSPIREEKRKGFGTEKTSLYTVALAPATLREDFFLVSEHRRRFREVPKRRPGEWTVVSVNHTGVVDDVFCAVVPDGHAFTLEANILTGNCGGYCCKAGLKQFANLRAKEPERYEFHAQEMERVLEEIGPTAKPFLRKTLDGELEYITLKQYERLLDTGSIDVPEFDAEGCGCFTDE